MRKLCELVWSLFGLVLLLTWTVLGLVIMVDMLGISNNAPAIPHGKFWEYFIVFSISLIVERLFFNPKND